MSNTAPFIQPVLPNAIEEEILPVKDVLVSQEITNNRLIHCLNCDKKSHEEIDIPKCSECNCSISMLTTLSFKTCPIGKW